MSDMPHLPPQVALFDPAPGDLASLSDVTAVDWLTCQPTGERQFDFLRGSERVARLDFSRPVLELPDLIAILACSDDAAWLRLQSAWQDFAPGALIALERVRPLGRGPGAEPEAILRSVLRHVAGRHAAQLAYAGRMALDLAEYRQQFETMQRSFAALEAHVTRAGTPPVHEVFALPRATNPIAVPAGGTAAVQQDLPVDSLGVGGVWLALTPPIDHGTGSLHAELTAIETGAQVAAWTITPSDATAGADGWTHLVLDRALDEAALSLRLSLRSSAEGWSVALGPPNPYPEFCARTAVATLGAPIALRVQATLAGLRVGMTTRTILQDAPSRPATRRLPDDSYAKIVELFVGDGEPSVHHDPSFGFIQVHPRGRGEVSAGRLWLDLPEASWSISAKIRLAHEEALPTWFALLTTRRPPGGPVDAADEASMLAAARDGMENFSGWFALSALQERTIATLLPRAAEGACALYLLTRQDGAPTFGWARFSDLTVHPLPAVVR